MTRGDYQQWPTRAVYLSPSKVGFNPLDPTRSCHRSQTVADLHSALPKSHQAPFWPTKVSSLPYGITYPSPLSKLRLRAIRKLGSNVPEIDVFHCSTDHLSTHHVDIQNLNMPSWRDEYLSALHERDKKEKSNQNLYASCLSSQDNIYIS